MKNQHFDLIGDIHGHYSLLDALLRRLGYNPSGPGFRHPEGRRVIFLGDYIDRGPEVRRVLQTVRAMVESGDALAIMGNHEFNAVCYHASDGRGGWLRDRSQDRSSGLLVTLEQFKSHPEEWADWLCWMRSLPMFLDLGVLRTVHACWDAASIARLAGKDLRDDEFLHASARSGSEEFLAVERILKGPELTMPEGCFFHDKHGQKRGTIRVRWWSISDTVPPASLAMPLPMEGDWKVTPEALAHLPNYLEAEPPVFCGHYWLLPGHPRAPQSPNVACLDYSAAAGGPLVAYRWDGEVVLSADKFVEAAAGPRHG